MPVMFHIKIQHKNINSDFANKILQILKEKNIQIFNFWYRDGKNIEYWSPCLFDEDNLLEEFKIPSSCVDISD